MKIRSMGMVAAGLALAFAVRADEQVWNDLGGDNIWSTNTANWAEGAVWTNNNSALFAGGGGLSLGEAVDIAAIVSVANITFQTNGYVIADANNDGTLMLTGMPSVVTVASAGQTGTVSEALGGSGGFTKAGGGVLNLTATNTYIGVTIVSNGILRLAQGILQGLGATGGTTGTGNNTVVTSGATLDFNGCYVNGTADEKFLIAGAGTDGKGVLVNKGAGHTNKNLAEVALQEDATIGGSGRIDVGVLIGNGKTLVKTGTHQLCMRNLTNAVIQIDEGMFTILDDARALGGTSPGDTTVNSNGKLDCWNTYSIPERIVFNGGALSQGSSGHTFYLTGHLTVNGSVAVNSGGSRGIEVSGIVDGPGGFTQQGDGWFYITGNGNTYTGPTIVYGGKPLWVGKTVGGTGRLGSGAVTNNGILYANSAVLGTGEVVNNTGASLYLNAADLSAGRIVNAGGTVYGTSVVQTAGGVVNSGTWQCYSGSFGSSSLTNASGGTLNLHTNVFTYGQFVNGGTLNILQPMTLSSPVTLTGGMIAVSSNSLLINGPVTVNGNTTISSTSAGAVEISVAIDGTGGFTQNGDGGLHLTSDANTYSGPTVVNGGKTLAVGKTPGATGTLGSGSVTNWGTLHANSERLCSGNVVNNGTLYWNSGLLSGSGAIVNNGNLYIDRGGAFVCSNAFFGSGTTYLRYGGEMTVSGSVSSNAQFKIGMGTLTLTNGADFRVYQEMQVADKIMGNMAYPAEPISVTAIINVSGGCVLTAQAITFGNGNNGSATGILNQAGGLVRTTGTAAEGNGIRLGHYPAAYSIYNMMGGTLTVEKDWDLGCATDGTGWFNMTGGEVFAKRVMLNERDSTGGFGRLTVAGGVLNLGSLSGSTLAVSNGIAADLTAPYLVQFGGAGGTVRAVTNIYSALNATLYGTNAAAITFDTAAFAITLAGNLTGTGGLNKAGAGVLTLAGTNSYAGATRVLAGTLTPASDQALPAGGVVAFGVAADGSGGRLHAPGDLSLAGVTVAVANPEALDKGRLYTVATYGGTLTAGFGASALPEPWYVYYDWEHKALQLRAAVGTLIKVR